MGNLPLPITLNLALNCWAVVTNVHNLVIFARRFPLSAESELSAFLQSAAVATSLRNFMDHRATNLQNFARTKGPVHPPYGIVSFLTPLNEEGHWDIHQIPMGTMHHAQHYFPIVDTALRPQPREISHVVLAAFGEQVSLSTLVADLNLAMVDFDRRVAKSVSEAIEAAARERGVDPKPLLEQHTGSIRIAMRLGLASSNQPPKTTD